MMTTFLATLNSGRARGRAGVVQESAVENVRPLAPTVAAPNAAALRDAVAALGSSSVGGDHQEVVTFAPAVSAGDRCAAPVTVTVPLKPSGRAGKTTLKMQSIAAGAKDSDKLKLTCLPAP